MHILYRRNATLGRDEGCLEVVSGGCEVAVRVFSLVEFCKLMLVYCVGANFFMVLTC